MLWNRFLLWLLIELGWLYLTPAVSVSETLIMGYLGQKVMLPCQYPSWSPDSNSMCWGKGECPKSKCKDELVHTDGTKVVSRTASRYDLPGIISQGNLSLTISYTMQSDASVYCCRIEVPGWFNDVKRNIRLQLQPAPKRTTARPQTTTSTVSTTTTKAWTSSTALLPTDVVTTAPALITTALLQTSVVALTSATTCPLTTESSLSSMAPTTEHPMEEHMSTTAVETSPLTSLPESSTSATSRGMNTQPFSGAPNTATLSSRDSQTWVFPSEPGAATRDVRHSTFPGHRASETSIPAQDQAEVELIQMTDHRDLLMIIIPSLGLLLFLVLLGIFLRGKITKTVCLQKHTRFEEDRKSQQCLGSVQFGQEDEDGLFTL